MTPADALIGSVPGALLDFAGVIITSVLATVLGVCVLVLCVRTAVDVS